MASNSVFCTCKIVKHQLSNICIFGLSFLVFNILSPSSLWMKFNMTTCKKYDKNVLCVRARAHACVVRTCVDKFFMWIKESQDNTDARLLDVLKSKTCVCAKKIRQRGSGRQPLTLIHTGTQMLNAMAHNTRMPYMAM